MLGTVALVSGVTSHVAAGGLLPHPVLLGGVLMACVGLAALFLRAPASPLRLVALVVGGQALTHGLLSFTAGHADAAAQAVVGAESHHGGAHLVEHAVQQGPLMLLAHTLGAVALGLWLAVGESALWHLLALTATRVRVLSATLAQRAPVLGSAPLVGAHDAARRLPGPVSVPVLLPLPDTLPHRLVTRRGPPALLAA